MTSGTRMACTPPCPLSPWRYPRRGPPTSSGSLQWQPPAAHRLNPSRMLQLHLPRHQERANLHVGRRLRLAHLFNRGRPVLFEVGSEREQEILVERSTRSLQGTARVSKANSEFHASPLPGGFTTAAYLSGPAPADARCDSGANASVGGSSLAIGFVPTP